MDDKSLNNIICLTFSLALVILVLILLVYMGNFHDYPIGTPSEFGAFGSYFGGIATPLLTFLTVIPLVLTLVSQQRQFRHQQNTQWLQSCVLRFEDKVQHYENLANSPVGKKTGPDAVILREVPFLDHESEAAQTAGELLDTIPGLMSGNEDTIPRNQIGNAIFLLDLANYGLAACNTFSYTFKYASKEDYHLLEDMQNKAKQILEELKKWRILTNEEQIASLEQRTEIPDNLHP